MTPVRPHATSGPHVRARRFDPQATLDQLPALVAELDPEQPIVVLDDLPAFDVHDIDEVLRPAMAALVDSVVDDLERASSVAIRGGVIEENVRRVTEHALRQFALAVESGQPQLDTRLYRELGRRHARAGWSLRELTTMIGRGGRACMRSLAAISADDGPGRDRIGRASEAVLAFTTALMTAAVEGYTEVQSTHANGLRGRRVGFVRRLLRGQIQDDEVAELEAEAAALGWPLPSHLVVAVSSPGAELGPLGPPDALVIIEGARHNLLLPHDGTTVALTAVAGTVAIGPRVPWRDAARSASVACELLALIDAGLVPAGGVQRCDDHAAELLLASQPALARALADRWLAPLVELPAGRRGPLLETLAAWLETPGQFTTLAERLHVHVRTVRYRVDRLRELLGSVVDDPSRRLELTLALRATLH